MDENADGDFSPFPSEKFFLLYCYAHSVMRPKSRSDLEFLWMMLDRFGVKLPSLSSVLSFKVEGLENISLRKSYGNGHPFYWISPSDIIKLQLATPSVSNRLARYPEKTDRFINELFQGLQWRIEDQFQTTSASVNGETFYVKDLVRYKLEETICHGQINGFYMKKVEDSLKYFCRLTKMIVTSVEFHSLAVTQEVEEVSLEDIQGESEYKIEFKEIDGQILQLTVEEKEELERPHGTKILADGKPTLTVPLVVFSDETSGNRSKKWNQLESYSMFLAGLPRKDVTKFSNIHFICASNLVDSVTLGKEIATDLKNLEEGMLMYDAKDDQQVFVQCPVLLVACDNPRASEFAHHMGSSATHFCRTCDATKETGAEVGTLRTTDAIQRTIERINTASTERQKKEIRRSTGNTERGGQFDILSSFEAIKQTPVEILHTILLGPVKYLVKKTFNNLSPADKKKVKSKIEAFDFSAFSRRLPSSFVKNHGSCVGRDFKLWAQISVFVLEGLISDEELQVWIYLSETFAMAYGSEVDIDDNDNTTNLIQEMMECLSEVHPELLQKQKFHMLLHIQDDMMKFGPPAGFNTERFEAFNSVIRTLNVYSNRHASSKDIGERLLKHHILKFVTNGGRWGINNRTFASQGLIKLSQQPVIQKFMYQVDSNCSQSQKEIYQPGNLRLETYQNGRLKQLTTVDVLPIGALQHDIERQHINIEQTCKGFKGCIAQDKTLVQEGETFAYKSYNDEICFGMFCTAVGFCHGGNWVLTIPYQLMRADDGDVLHGKFTSPVLQKCEERRLISTKNILEKVSLVHNCDNRCSFVNTDHPIVEEREIVTSERCVYQHDLSNKYYLLNRFYLGESWKYIPGIPDM
ncbi:Hypothetical predicted protein [Paramuricea clavata]|uniref:Uncharacterized protein n=1 Tax=Paramuricea clavata TaxID=317549 RepID=A0A6S7HYL6_PARCT|nr:Hypothetical predicted protein [Paramuricea clavata]